jgi:hypothetical protein
MQSIKKAARAALKLPELRRSETFIAQVARENSKLPPNERFQECQ